MLKRFIHLCLIVIMGFLFLTPASNTIADDPYNGEFWVNSFQDLPDNAHNSVCSAGQPTDGPCTLRAAIFEANLCTTDSGACDLDYAIIHVPAGTYTLSLPGTNENANDTGDLDISAQHGIQIIIEGDPVNPTVINANGIDRVFHVLSNVTLRYLVIQGGHLEVDTAGGQTYQNGGGIANSGNLSLENVIIQDNHLTCIDPPAKPTINNCYQAIGGGLFNSGVLTMNNSTIRNNTAARGAGIFHNNTITTAQIFHSTLSGNQAFQSGGGLENYGKISLINSTISNNFSPFIGGVYNNTSSYLTLINVTIASNQSTISGVTNLGNYGNLTIQSSIVAYPGGQSGAVNCTNSGTWIAAQSNLYSDNSCPGGAGVFSNTDPRLSALAWLGGPTMTRGLLSGSPAHNAYAGFCLDQSGGTITIDQRGQNRDNQCDLGAYEGVAYQVYLPVLRR